MEIGSERKVKIWREGGVERGEDNGREVEIVKTEVNVLRGREEGRDSWREGDKR